MATGNIKSEFPPASQFVSARIALVRFTLVEHSGGTASWYRVFFEKMTRKKTKL